MLVRQFQTVMFVIYLEVIKSISRKLLECIFLVPSISVWLQLTNVFSWHLLLCFLLFAFASILCLKCCSTATLSRASTAPSYPPSQNSQGKGSARVNFGSRSLQVMTGLKVEMKCAEEKSVTFSCVVPLTNM